MCKEKTLKIIEKDHYLYMVGQVKDAAAKLVGNSLSPDKATFLFSYTIDELSKVRCRDLQLQEELVGGVIIFIKNLGLPLQADRLKEFCSLL